MIEGAAVTPRPLILQAIEALQQGDKQGAVRFITEDLRTGPPNGERWRSLSKLAAHIGEIDLAIEASLRHSQTEPVTLDRLIGHWGTLASFGRSGEGVEAAHKLPAAAQAQPALLHFLGSIASEQGDFALAEDYFRRALAVYPNAPQTWFALTMIKTFTPDDPDIVAMSRLESSIGQADPQTQARYFYGMAKAHDDLGDIEKSFDYYARGAALRRLDQPYDVAEMTAFVDGLIRDFTPARMASLRPSQFEGQRAIFVNGLPRSGTTLVEQILASHSKVVDGGEFNLARAALTPTVDYSFAGAMRWQDRAGSDDPWGDIARDYHRMLGMRFPKPGLVVDKTLSQSTLMGLMLHSMPDARIIWMRRRPEDSALSSYRSFFTSQVPWSWSLTDIGAHYREEDRLFDHWVKHFGDRILVVPYEELTREPEQWIPRLLAHAGLEDEPQVRDFHLTRRGVRTASVKQVRSPITTKRIGAAERYQDQLRPFFDAYTR